MLTEQTTARKNNSYVKQPITLQELAHQKFGGRTTEKLCTTSSKSKVDGFPLGSNAQKVLDRCLKPANAAVVNS